MVGNTIGGQKRYCGELLRGNRRVSSIARFNYWSFGMVATTAPVGANLNFNVESGCRKFGIGWDCLPLDAMIFFPDDALWKV